jgi:DHA1 family multidrug resistance protein-like MFS transporter
VADLWGNARLRAALWVVFWASFALGATSPILELHVRDLVPGDADTARFATSVLFSASALVGLLAMPVWGRHGDRAGHARALVECALGSALALALQAVPVYAVLLGARIVFGAAAAGSAACSFGLAASEAPVERRGGAFGVVFSARTLAAAIAAPLGGWLSRWVGVPGLFLGCGAGLLAAGLALRASYVRPSARSADGG